MLKERRPTSGDLPSSSPNHLQPHTLGWTRDSSVGTGGLHTHLGPNCPSLSHQARQAPPPGPEPGPRPTGPQPSSGQLSSHGLPPPTGQTPAGGKRLSRAQTTLVVRMCSIARRRLPATRLTDVPSGERTWAATATQTQQELSPWARATARQLAPGSVHRAGAAGQRRLLETLPQTRQRPRGVEAGEELRPRESGAWLFWSRCASYSASCLWRAHQP